MILTAEIYRRLHPPTGPLNIIIPYYTIMLYNILYYIIYNVILYNVILYYTILYYIKEKYTLLY